MPTHMLVPSTTSLLRSDCGPPDSPSLGREAPQRPARNTGGENKAVPVGGFGPISGHPEKRSNDLRELRGPRKAHSAGG
jgi:hypothetical protein